MSADWEINLEFPMLEAALAAVVPIALGQGAEHLRGVSVSRTPDGEGHLREDAGWTVHGAGVDSVAEVKYPGPYAAFQNRGMRADGTHVIENRPGGGQTGFLTETMVDQKQATLDVVADVIRQHL